MDWLIWFFTDRIFGTLLFTAGAYGVAKLVKVPVPEVVGVVVFVLCLLTLPTYPRYKFERDTFAELAKHPEYRIVEKTYWGSSTEPVTWFHHFVGHVRAIAPDPMNSPEDGAAFKGIVFSYKEEPREWMYDVWCKDSQMSSASPDDNGVFRLTSKDWQPISAEDRMVFCDTDWSKQTRYVLDHR